MTIDLDKLEAIAQAAHNEDGFHSEHHERFDIAVRPATVLELIHDLREAVKASEVTIAEHEQDICGSSPTSADRA